MFTSGLRSIMVVAWTITAALSNAAAGMPYLLSSPGKRVTCHNPGQGGADSQPKIGRALLEKRKQLDARPAFKGIRDRYFGRKGIWLFG